MWILQYFMLRYAVLWPQIIAHSVGTWNAYEFLRLAQQRGLPMPLKAFLSAMASPDIPWEKRPWRQQRGLSEADFKVGAQHQQQSWHLCHAAANNGCGCCLLGDAVAVTAT